MKISFLFFFLYIENGLTKSTDYCQNSQTAKNYLDNIYGPKYETLFTGNGKTYFANRVNKNSFNENKKNSAASKYQTLTNEGTNVAKNCDFNKVTDNDLKRRFHFMVSAPSVLKLSKASFNTFLTILGQMEVAINDAKICPVNNKQCTLNTDGVTITNEKIDKVSGQLSSSNYDDVTYAWKAYKDLVGNKLRTSYPKVIPLANEAAKAAGKTSVSQDWLSDYTYDMSNPNQDYTLKLDNLFNDVKPLFKKIHAWIRYKSIQNFGTKYTGQPNEPIPAQVYENIKLPLFKPYPQSATSYDSIKTALSQSTFTVEKMFDSINEMYKNMGLVDLINVYKNDCGKADTPANRKCQESKPYIEKLSWSNDCMKQVNEISYSPIDIRIGGCFEKEPEELYTIADKLGSAQYCFQYKDQPAQFREPANIALYWSIGKAIYLGAKTSSHLKSVKLMDQSTTISHTGRINELMNMAFTMFKELTNSYAIDKFRFNLFDGNIPVDQMNSNWWKIRENTEGVVPPVMRSESNFDLTNSIAADHGQLVHSFLANIAQFQIYRALCVKSGQFDPNDSNSFLHECNFSTGSKASDAGTALKDFLKEGRSKSWQTLMNDLTGSNDFNANALKEYFKPLEQWLDIKIASNSIPVDWVSTYATKMT